MKKLLIGLIALLLCAAPLQAQTAPEVTVSLNEAFLNSFLDAVFTNLDTPKFDLAKKPKAKKGQAETVKTNVVVESKPRQCQESVTLLRENNGVRTAVQFNKEKIVAPLAFVGTYDVPFVGCSEFRGVAFANINLEYNRENRVLYGRVKVIKVDLNGVPGLASGIVARLVQGTIDSRVNPLEILRADQVSAVVPVQYANGAIKLRAVEMKPEITANALNVRVTFEFAKAFDNSKQ